MRNAVWRYCSMKALLIREALQQGTQTLRHAGIEGAARESRLLMGLCLGWNTQKVWRDDNLLMPSEPMRAFRQLVARRARHESYARLSGVREFWSLEFCVNEFVLEPRADSEAVVRAALRHHTRNDGLILDLGTGSGCLLAACLHERQDARGVGVDRCFDACATARANWHQLGLHYRTDALCCDWGAALHAQFDLIVCNPPYVRRKAIDALPFAKHEPKRALDGGEDGLDAYRQILTRTRDVLTFDGRLVIEIGDDSSHDVTMLLEQSGLHCVDKEYDLAGAIRALVACVKR